MTQAERLAAAAKAVASAAGRCAEAGLHDDAKGLRTLADNIFQQAERAREPRNYVGKIFTVTGRD